MSSHTGIVVFSEKIAFSKETVTYRKALEYHLFGGTSVLKGDHVIFILPHGTKGNCL